MSKSQIKVLYSSVEKKDIDGKRSILDKTVINGPKGVLVKYYVKNDSEKKKIIVKCKEEKCEMLVFEGESKEPTKKELTYSELTKMIKKTPELEFAGNFDLKPMAGGKPKKSYGSKKASKSKSKSRSKSRSRK